MQPIGIFDSGFGGLTVFKSILNIMPQYDYLYLGDNARAPYGNRSFETIYEYTLEAVKWLFDKGCPLVILACNTASAKALRSIQQKNKLLLGNDRRVLGVIRPTAEVIGNYTKSKSIGILGTTGTIQSGSYLLEIEHFFPDLIVSQKDCPLWVPLIENGEYKNQGTKYFIYNDIDLLLQKDAHIDTLLLACTHYPLIQNIIQEYVTNRISVINQGDIIANSLANYLQRHPEIETQITKHGKEVYYTTDDPKNFDKHGSDFLGKSINSKFTELNKHAIK